MNQQYHDHCKQVNNVHCFTLNNSSCSLPAMSTPLGDRLLQAMSYAGLTQVQLAEQAGVSQQAISRLITGKQKATTDLVALAIACKVRPEWMYSGEGPMFYYEGARDAIQESLRVMEALPQELVEENLRNLKTLSRLSNQEPPKRPVTATGGVSSSIGPAAKKNKGKKAA